MYLYRLFLDHDYFLFLDNIEKKIKKNLSSVFNTVQMLHFP